MSINNGFNSASLYYQIPDDLPEAEGLACRSFAMPIEGEPVVAHTRVYLKATEVLKKRLFSSCGMPSAELTKYGKQFRHNITIAQEVQNALLGNLMAKTQRAHAQMRQFAESPVYPHIALEASRPVHIHTPPEPVAVPQQVITASSSQQPQESVKWVANPNSKITMANPFLADALVSVAQSSVSAFSFFAGAAFSVAGAASSYVMSAASSFVSEATSVSQGHASALEAYAYEGVEKQEPLFEALREQTSLLKMDLNALTRNRENGIEDELLEADTVQTIQKYEATLQEMEALMQNMRQLFENFKGEQEDYWRRFLYNLQNPSKDHVESDVKGEQAQEPMSRVSADRGDPRRELLFMQRLQEKGLNVHNVPGDDHCVLYALFKDPQVLGQLRRLFPQHQSPESPSDTLTRDIKQTRQLIVNRLKIMLRNPNEPLALQIATDIEDCGKSKNAYFNKHGSRYTEERASPEQRKMLEECYWDGLAHGRVHWSNSMLAALSTLLKRPVFVYSVSNIRESEANHHLLRLSEAGAPLPEGVRPIERCYTEIPVGPQYALYMNREQPIRLYFHGQHYQAMTLSND